MRKFLLLIVVTVGLFFTGNGVVRAANATYGTPDSVLLHYRSGSILLYDTYKDNSAALDKLGRFVNANRASITDGRYHLALYGYITASEVDNKRAVNTASIQASVVRTYLKTRFQIPLSCFTFDIDTTQNQSNVVQVQLMRGPIQAYANTAIHYSESRNLSSIADAFSQYKNGVPYTSYLMLLAKREALGMSGSHLYAIGDRSGAKIRYSDDGVSYGDDDEQYAYSTPNEDTIQEPKTMAGYYIKSQSGGFEPAPKDALATGVNLIYVQSDEGKYAPASSSQLVAFAPKGSANASALEDYGLYQKEGLVRTEPYAVASQDAPQRDYPVVGVKTNLAYWLAAMPNGELEFYMGKMFSLNFEGQYSWLSNLLKPTQEKAYYIWGASVEFRVWFNSNRAFNGLYIGAYGHAGQYDFKFSEIGNQGDYFGGGVSVGYMLPLGKHFNMEFGLGLGYVSYMDTRYKWNSTLKPAQNVFISKAEKSYIGPTKLKVALVWKF